MVAKATKLQRPPTTGDLRDGSRSFLGCVAFPSTEYAKDSRQKKRKEHVQKSTRSHWQTYILHNLAKNISCTLLEMSIH